MIPDSPGPRPAWAQELHRVTHDLRSPLASIAGYADLLHRRVYGELNESQGRAVDAIHRRTQDLKRRLDGFADWLYLCTNEPLPPAAPTGLHDLLEAEAELIDCDLRIDGAGEAMAVPGALGTALRELLRNAQAVATAPVQARIRAGGSSVVVEIEDDGPGPPDELVEGRTRPEAGVRRAAGWLARMGGELIFIPASARGTIARVTLPIAQDAP